ncbi:MAG: GYD domain-containing protein [Ignavibacteriales bacterium]|nr:GYD domain-containing protein [Ignavibacteriales bacterium]
MATYILLTKLSPDESKKVHNRAKLGHVWLEEVKAKCPEVNFVSHYALLGRYDFMDIYEAPNEKVAAKVSMISLANGAYTSESITAIPYKEFTELLSEL